MKTKLVMIIVGVVVILLMSGIAIVQGEDTYPIDNGYPVGYPVDEGYPVDYGYPIYEGYPEPIQPVDEGYPIDFYEPVSDTYQLETLSYPEIPDSSIEPVQPKYRNGRNLWQEIVYQFGKLLELMK
jgi:hypothetical protein